MCIFVQSQIKHGNSENIYSGLLTTGKPHRIWVFYTKMQRGEVRYIYSSCYITHLRGPARFGSAESDHTYQTSVLWAGGCISCTLTIYYETVGVDSAWLAHGEQSCISGLHQSKKMWIYVYLYSGLVTVGWPHRIWVFYTKMQWSSIHLFPN